MPIRIRDSADPLSERALRGDREVIIARSDAGRVLRQELLRYCNGQIQGRSFLIAGHRGAGKTTMVHDAMYQVMLQTRMTGTSLRPLPIFLHGPSLLETLPSDLRRDGVSLADTANGSDQGDGRKKNGQRASSEPAAEDEARKPNVQQSSSDERRDGEPLAQETPASEGTQGSKSTRQARFTEEEEKQAQLALVHLILSLHRAVMKTYADAYRRTILERAGRLAMHDGGELAAQFEIELLEDPPASRLREYWQHADALKSGILFENRVPDQGARELVAINGICNAHQRISGALGESLSEKRQGASDRDTSRGLDVRAVDALKPLGVVLAGAAVGGGAAVGSGSWIHTGLLGLAAAVMSSMFLKRTITTSNKRQRSLDRTFIPDLTPRTLDRVLPTLLDRLREAGLAPVLVIDELDKVDNLAKRIENLIRYLKKLMAENVFSCFLTDRGYLEYLRIDRADVAYGRASSYFSHRLMVAYAPRDVDAYLSELLEAKDAPNDASGVDCEVLKWVLRHRSQLHGLTLSRELADIRRDDGQLNIPAGAIRTDFQYRIDVTLQMAIELQSYSKEVMGWLQRQQTMRQTLFDALYYLSRSWLSGDRCVDMSDAGKRKILADLTARMNLNEACTENSSENRQSDQQNATSVTQAGPLSEDDEDMLMGVLEGIVRFLSPANTPKAVLDSWHAVIERMGWSATAIPVPEVMNALLLGQNDSLLVPSSACAKPAARKRKRAGDGAAHHYEWRYWRSGLLRDPRAAKLKDSEEIRARAAAAVGYIELIENSLLSVLADVDSAEGLQVFGVLSEGCRVLNTTPAWPQVRAAMINLSQLANGEGNPSSIERDCRLVEDFAQLLREAEQSVQRVLLSTAVLCGVSGAGSQPLRMLEALAMLSAGLGFAKLDHVGVYQRADLFWGELRRLYGEEHLGAVDANGKPVDLTSTSFAHVAHECFEKGRQWSLNLDGLRVAAWSSVERRLDSQEAGNGQQYANVAEVLCAARQIGPSPAPGLDLDRIPLDVWTSILLDIAVPRATSNSAETKPPSSATDTPPRWLAAFALRRVGAHNLAPTIVEGLLKALNASRDRLDERFHALARGGSQTLRGAGNGNVAIVVRTATSSLTEAWTMKPTLGMVWVVDIQELSQGRALKFLKRVLQDHQTLLVWEEPADSAERQSKFMESYADSTGPVVLPLYLYPRARMATKSPSVVDPSGPDALFRRARTNESPKP